MKSGGAEEGGRNRHRPDGRNRGGLAGGRDLLRPGGLETRAGNGRVEEAPFGVTGLVALGIEMHPGDQMNPTRVIEHTIQYRHHEAPAQEQQGEEQCAEPDSQRHGNQYTWAGEDLSRVAGRDHGHVTGHGSR